MHSAVLPPSDSGIQFGLATTQAGNAPAAFQFASEVGEPLLASRTVNGTALLEYRLVEDPDTRKLTLWRYESAYPLADGATAGQSDDTRAVPLLSGVTGVSYLFYSSSQQTWVESWDGETGLPTAVRMDLQLGEEGEEEPRQESWTFSIPAAGATNESGAATGASSTSGTTDGAGQ
jgi:hypothetical protein